MSRVDARRARQGDKGGWALANQSLPAACRPPWRKKRAAQSRAGKWRAGLRVARPRALSRAESRRAGRVGCARVSAVSREGDAAPQARRQGW